MSLQQDKEPQYANEVFVGRYGVVLSSITHLGPDLDLLFAQHAAGKKNKQGGSSRHA